MNIIRIENVKSSLATTFSLTLNVEKHKDLNKTATVVILSEEDINNINSLIKLKSVNIDYLVIPKKFKYSFQETEYFEQLHQNLTEEYKTTYY